MTTRTRARDLTLLLEASRRLNRTLYLDSLLVEIRDLVREAVSAEAVSLLVWDEEISQLEIYIAHNRIWVEGTRPALAPKEGIGGWIAEHNKAFLTNDAASETQFADLTDKDPGFATRSLLGVPLRRAGNVYGVLEALNSTSPEGFGRADLQLLEALADPISVSLDNALTFQIARRERAQNEALYRVGLVLNRKLSLEEIIEVLLDQLQNVVPSDAAALYLLQPGTSDLSWFRHRGYKPGTEEQVNLKLGSGLVGWVAGSRTPLVVPDVTAEPRYVNARPSTRSEIVVPIESEGRILGVLNLEADELGRFTGADLRVATAFANQAAISIERAQMIRQLEEKARLEHELSVARHIQQMFLPAAVPDIPEIDLAGINLPSTEVSGDAYDYLMIADRQLALMIGDVSGKGVSAALIMATLRASLRAEARNRYSIEDIVPNVNRLLWESIELGQFVTAFYGVLDLSRMRFSYVNAGHNAPVLMRANGEVERLRTGGPMLGPFPNRKYDLGIVDLRPGDMLHFYTDGVTEAGATRGDAFGPARLIEVLRQSQGQSSEAVNQAVLNAVDAHDGLERYDDDVTLMTLRVLDPGATGSLGGRLQDNSPVAEAGEPE